MNAAADASLSFTPVNGFQLELIDRGHGRPILFLHSHLGLETTAPVLGHLARGGRLIAPSHPGFGHSERPPGITTGDDLSYFYLDLMDALDLRETQVIGVSFGAWIAAAIAVKSTARIASLVLANPVGIKVSDRETRDIPDIFAMLEDEFIRVAFADPSAGRRNYAAMPDDEITVVARNREAAALYAWSPYMHDPKLKGRLHRIDVPTRVFWGADDRLVRESYGRAFCAAIPLAEFELIKGAGHFPDIEQPEVFAERALAFADQHSEQPPVGLPRNTAASDRRDTVSA